jgi:hypothetical protein
LRHLDARHVRASGSTKSEQSISVIWLALLAVGTALAGQSHGPAAAFGRNLALGAVWRSVTGPAVNAPIELAFGGESTRRSRGCCVGPCPCRPSITTARGDLCGRVAHGRPGSRRGGAPIGTALDLATVALIGWLGPCGLASVVFWLIAGTVNESGPPNWGPADDRGRGWCPRLRDVA